VDVSIKEKLEKRGSSVWHSTIHDWNYQLIHVRQDENFLELDAEFVLDEFGDLRERHQTLSYLCFGSQSQLWISSKSIPGENFVSILRLFV
jgi:hypothetical protein